MSGIVFDLDAIGTKSNGLIDWATTIVELKNKGGSGRNSRKLGSEIAFDHTRDSGGSHDQCSTSVLEVRALAINLDCGADISCSNTSDSIYLLEEEVSTQSSRNSADIEIPKFGSGGKKSNTEEGTGRKNGSGDGGLGRAGVDLKFGSPNGEEEAGKIKGELGDAQASDESRIGKLEATSRIGDRGERAAIGINIEVRIAKGKRSETSVGLLDEEIGSEGLTGDLDRDLCSFKREGRPGANMERFFHAIEFDRFIHSNSAGVNLEIEISRNGDIGHVEGNSAAHARGQSCGIDGDDALAIDELERAIAEVCLDFRRARDHLTIGILLKVKVSRNGLIENRKLSADSSDADKWPFRNADTARGTSDRVGLGNRLSGGIDLETIGSACRD